MVVLDTVDESDVEYMKKASERRLSCYVVNFL